MDDRITRRTVLAGSLVALSGCSFRGSDNGDRNGTPTPGPDSVTVGEGGSFDSVQAAIETVAAGGRVEIAAGRYREAISVDKPDLTIVGTGEVTVSPGETVDTAGISVAESASGVTIDGVTVTGFTGSRGTISIRGDDATVRNTVVTDGFLGVRTFASTVTIEATEVSGCNTGGVLVRNGESATFTDVTVESNGGPGIDVDRTTTVGIEGAVVRNNASRGIDLDRVDVATVRDSTATGNESYGVDIEQCGEVTIEGVVADENRNGIDLEGNDSAEITNTVTRTNGFHGIAIDQVDTVTIDRTTTSDNGAAGIDCNRASDVTLSGVASTANETSGVRLVRFDEANVSSSNLTDNGGIGLSLADARIGSTETFAVSETILANNAIGLDLQPLVSADGNVVETCQIAGNETYGIRNGSRSQTLLATDNWWGTEDGPGTDPEIDQLVDPETGTAADGDGNWISSGRTAGVASVRFDPVATSPPPEPTAGAETA
ncbi:right-handed parallel beta-helix repeat-containing protein [Halapricum hydrolyticum]|uniref:Right-handed parallel beta-helix repeat-containing protein n=1 Tax=Halapricum hydrolyticum TaxID=2979991 RepID=A0AAE3IAT6_9EURY|nr:right-handed parallel beta-helix repeat-containing protein [Halapricum hydrolyticum]MCU4718220.1 right-handed parallel beta-helix repeat-containing protein [Halapricum hydrolyticum]MCU4726339.1 right-handed parallel beta-helix repeat-containing protein [Halapricum hydrolyticum]